MRKPIVLFGAICLVLIYSLPGWAQLSPDQEKRLKDLEAKEKILKDWEKNKPQIEERMMERESGGISQGVTRKEPQDYGSPLSNESVGRYQAVRVESNAVFIMDTKEGHMWIWVIQKDKQGQPVQLLFYQGQVIPGMNMGDLIDSTVNKSR